MKQILFILPLLIYFNIKSINAQDFHISNIPESLPILNPSAIIQNDSRLQFTGIIRQQWNIISNPFTTQLINIEKSTHLYNRIINTSLLFINQDAGKNSITTNRILLTLAYKTILPNYSYSLGFQGGLIAQHINTSNLTTPSQYDELSGSFNQSLPSMENNNSLNNKMLVFNTGITVSKKIKNVSIETGISINYLNQPKNKLTTNETKTPVKTAMHVKALFINNTPFEQRTLFIWQNTKHANEITTGYILQYNKNFMANSFKNIALGTFIRTGINRSTDALIIHIGTTWKRLTMYFDYDITISSLSKTIQHRGASEICLKYTIPNKITASKQFDCQRY